MVDDTTLQSYEDVPYEAAPEFETHPDTLATLAYLHGMSPAPVTSCRVLELGCATGGNIIPVAAVNPESRFTGLDLSPRQVKQAQSVSAALNLKNTDFRAASITDVDASWGQFDYILCHGVYSWVPPFVQDKILDVCSANLAPGGVAYVSYNCYPGWRQRTVLRDLFKFHTRDITDPRAKVAAARAILPKLAESIAKTEGPYAGFLNEEVKVLEGVRDTYVLHEFLEDNNEPLHFTEFARRLADKKLQYLSEASPWLGAHGKRTHQLQKLLGHLPDDIVEREQYLDFLVNRTFRRSLIVHADVPLTRPMIPERVVDLSITGLARPVSENPDLFSDKEESFITQYKTSVTSNSPLVKTALALLHTVWPQPVPFRAIAAEVRRHLSQHPEIPLDDHFDMHLANAFLQAYPSRLVEMHLSPVRFARQVSDKPEAFPFTRIQAADGLNLLTNMLHRSVVVEEFDRLHLALLDGAKTHHQIARELLAILLRGDVQMSKDNQPITDEAQLRAFINDYLPDALDRFARSAMLIH